MARLLLDSLPSLEGGAAAPPPSPDASHAGMGAFVWLLIGLATCCCWGLTNCLLHIAILRRPMHDFGGRVSRVNSVDELRQALASADANGQLVVVLACAGWHHGCRVAARALSQMSLEFSSESCVFLMCDLATATSVAQFLQIVVIPTFKLFQNQVQVESHASFSRMRAQLEFHGATRNVGAADPLAGVELQGLGGEGVDEERAALVHAAPSEDRGGRAASPRMREVAPARPLRPAALDAQTNEVHPAPVGAIQRASAEAWQQLEASSAPGAFSAV
ncbi:hypothetical protein AB1Y20_015565 [Prymnesium parvum]|uniref:Thioredoxin domain-containing protein n=1 Tax=Prymnesium parvum TaxID=97485 RepID=A0AB34JX48_PRYPA